MEKLNLEITTAYNQFLRELLVTFPEIAKEQEIEILINSYSKTELAQICIIALEVIKEKNKFIQELKCR